MDNSQTHPDNYRDNAQLEHWSLNLNIENLKMIRN